MKRISANDTTIRVFDDVNAAATVWSVLERDGERPSGFQRWLWIEGWQRHIGAPRGVRPAITVVEASDGTPLMLMPWGLHPQGRLLALAWLGGAITGYHGPLISNHCPPELLDGEFDALWRRICTQLPRFDFAHLERQPFKIGTFRNPFLRLGPSLKEEFSPVARLDEDFDADYRKRISSKSRETDRRKVRKLKHSGEVVFEIAQDLAHADEIIDALIRQKSLWLDQSGLFPMFADGTHERFLRQMVRDHGDVVSVAALRVDGQIWATHWALVADESFYFWFTSYEQGELTRYSPGDMLVRLLIEWCCNHGVHNFDFGIGDHPYKLRWADVQVPLHECIVPTSPAGWIYVCLFKLNVGARRKLRQFPGLHTKVLAIRTRVLRRA